MKKDLETQIVMLMRKGTANYRKVPLRLVPPTRDWPKCSEQRVFDSIAGFARYKRATGAAGTAILLSRNSKTQTFGLEPAYWILQSFCVRKEDEAKFLKLLFRVLFNAIREKGGKEERVWGTLTIEKDELWLIPSESEPSITLPRRIERPQGEFLI